VSLLYLKRDSYGNENYYIYLGQRYKLSDTLALTAGVHYGFKYESPLLLPTIGFRWHMIQVSTTAPMDRLHKGADTTLVHVQYNIPLDF